jgi:16S rRNA (cytosine967-C5)-methyltransferase
MLALDAELHRATRLDARDAALATELVYGVLRTEGALEERLAAHARRRTWAQDPHVRAHVLMGAYSLCFLDRIPPFAAVGEAVQGVAQHADTRVVGFANAVLRKLAGRIEQEGRPLLLDAIAASMPGWLRGELRRSLGRSGAAAFMSAGPVPPPIGLSLDKHEDRDHWIARLRAEVPGAAIEPGLVSPRAIDMRGAGDVRRLPGLGTAWIVQEQGAQAVALALGARAGERVLDACAGRGNKAWGLGQDVLPGGSVDAADIHGAKLALLREGPAGRLIRATYTVDWTADSSAVPNDYDRVLVDAPCSGVGTLRRRPELARRRASADLDALRDLQVRIVLGAAAHAREGGRLVYAVCSVLRNEAEDVIERLVHAPEGRNRITLSPAPFDTVIPLPGADASSLRLLPQVHGTDGYFMASFIVTRR